MLTPEQYEALKAIKALDDNPSGSVKINAELVLDLFDDQLLWAMPTRKSHAAISEYEAAHNINQTKE